MSKRGQAVQLQADVQTEEEWEEFLSKSGLLLADVYSDWCGPCVGMVSLLRKLKMEVAGDVLSLAIVKSDAIGAFERFRGKSEPTWVFLSDKKIVNVMFGSNAPRLGKIIVSEVTKQRSAIEEERPRDGVELTERTGDDKSRWDEEEAEREIKEAEAEALAEKKRAELHRILMETLTEELKGATLVLYFPICFEPEDRSWPVHNKLMSILSEMSISLKKDLYLMLEPELAAKIIFEVEEEELSEEFKEMLESGRTVVKWLGMEVEEDVMPSPSIEAIVSETFYGHPPPTEEEPQVIDPESIAKTFGTEEFLAGWSPSTLTKKLNAFITFFPDFVNQFRPIVHKPLQPVIIIIMKGAAIDDVEEILSNNMAEIVRYGFFDKDGPKAVREVASNFDDYYAIRRKTGYEKLVVGVDAAKEECLLGLSVHDPLYVSINSIVGKEEFQRLFPKRDVMAQSIENYPIPMMTSKETPVLPIRKRSKRAEQEAREARIRARKAARKEARIEAKKEELIAAGIEITYEIEQELDAEDEEVEEEEELSEEVLEEEEVEEEEEEEGALKEEAEGEAAAPAAAPTEEPAEGEAPPAEGEAAAPTEEPAPPEGGEAAPPTEEAEAPPAEEAAAPPAEEAAAPPAEEAAAPPAEEAAPPPAEEAAPPPAEAAA